ALPRAALGTQNQIDLAILTNQLDQTQFAIEEMRAAEKNPRFYTEIIGDGIDPLVTRDFAPLGERAASLVARLRTVDAGVAAAAARVLLAQTQDEMVETAKEVWPTVFKTPLPIASTSAEKKALVRKVLDKLADDRSDNKTILSDATKLLGEATEFVKKENIVR